MNDLSSLVASLFLWRIHISITIYLLLILCLFWYICVSLLFHHYFAFGFRRHLKNVEPVPDFYAALY